VASYYGGSFDGRRTASGERFDEHALTAASREYPLGSVVKVTNLDSGRSVVVRINDRGPYVRGRNLDLSKGAAQKIGLVHKGVGRVRITRLDGSKKRPGRRRRHRKRRIRASALST
jgi:rare lipoprotein A